LTSVLQDALPLLGAPCEALHQGGMGKNKISPKEVRGEKKTKPTGNDGQNQYPDTRSTKTTKMGPKTTTDAADKKPKVTKQQENAGT
jgi:hypothetical protein